MPDARVLTDLHVDFASCVEEVRLGAKYRFVHMELSAVIANDLEFREIATFEQPGVMLVLALALINLFTYELKSTILSTLIVNRWRSSSKEEVNSVQMAAAGLVPMREGLIACCQQSLRSTWFYQLGHCYRREICCSRVDVQKKNPGSGKRNSEQCGS